MKTLSYLKMLCLLFVMSLAAQSAFSQVEVMIGGRTGINVSSFRWDTPTRNNKDLSTKSVIGPHVSFTAVIKIAPWFGVQAEAGYGQRGAKKSFDGENVKIKNEQGQEVTYKELSQQIIFKTNYIDVPLLARFQLGSDNFAFIGKLGPTFSIALNGTSQFTQDVTDAQGVEQPTYSKTTKLNFDKEFNRFDIGATVAIGTEIKAGPGAIIFDLRYILGITDATKAKKIDDRVKNRSFQIGAGYIVRL